MWNTWKIYLMSHVRSTNLEQPVQKHLSLSVGQVPHLYVEKIILKICMTMST